MFWEWFPNVHHISITIIVIICIYFLITTPKRKYSFVGLGKPIHLKKKKRNSSKFEEKCRIIFQRIFGVRFDKIRPQWLKNPLTGKNLELDGYNPTIKTQIGYGLAFEADGMQHMFRNPYYHKTKNDFIYQFRKDGLKDRICREKGILLIRIPFYAENEGLEEFIVGKLKQSFKKKKSNDHHF